MRTKLAELILLSLAVVPCVPKVLHFVQYLQNYLFLWGGTR